MSLTEWLPILGAVVLAYVGLINARSSTNNAQSKQSEVAAQQGAAITTAWLSDRAELMTIRTKLDDVEKRSNENAIKQMDTERARAEAERLLEAAKQRIADLLVENAALKAENAQLKAQQGQPKEAK